MNRRPVEINVEVKGDLVIQSPPVQETLDQILVLLTAQGAAMSALSDAVDTILANEATEDEQAAQALAAANAIIADLQSQIADLGTQLTTAQTQEAADAQTIADTQAALDAQAADVATQVDRLLTAFPSLAPPTP